MQEIKKVVILLGAILFICNGCTDNSKENDLKKENLKGKVKSIHTVWYRGVEKFGEISKDKHISSFKKIFNDAGYIVEDKSFGYAEDPTRKNIYIYDDKNRLIEQKRENFDQQFKSWWGESFRHVYKYDEKGNRIEEALYDIYNQKGIYSVEKYAYDNKGNMIEMNEYNSDGNLEKKIKYSYDNKGNKIEENEYNQDGKPESRWRYKYDSFGNQIEASSFDFEKDKFNFTITRRFDKQGNEVESSDDGYNSNKDNYEYEYDNNKNWIKSVYYRDGKLHSITERTIEYYD